MMNEPRAIRNTRGYLQRRWRARHAVIALFVCAVGVGLAASSPAADWPQEPILRIETGSHTAQIRRIATDAERRWLATASDDKTVRLWNLASGQLVRTLRPPIADGNEGALYAVAVSPNGKWIATGGWTGWALEQLANIYVFDRESGEIQYRIGNLPGKVTALAWSQDGRWLAAGLARNGGVHLFRATDFAPAGHDLDYSSSVLGLDISIQGRIVASSLDGDLRLYEIADQRLARIQRRTAPKGSQPHGVRFSPNGHQIAVGFYASVNVEVVSGETLRAQFEPDTKGVGNLLYAVAWSDNGESLYAGGLFVKDGTYLIRRWPMQGKGKPIDIRAAPDAIADILPLPRSELVFGSGDPGWGVVDSADKLVRYVGPASAGVLHWSKFAVSRDGLVVGGAPAGPERVASVFDVTRLGFTRELPANLALPRTEASGLSVKNLNLMGPPTLDGVPLPIEPLDMGRAVSVSPDNQSFVLGTNFYVYAFDRARRMLWRVQTTGVVRALNISGDGRLVIAALADSTLRWYRMSDGKPLAALSTDTNLKRWVLWSAAGFYAASPGGEDLLGWHLNRGSDHAADFFSASRFRERLYRPDIVVKVLELGDEAAAIEQAALETGRGALGAPDRERMPPVVQILSPGEGSRVSGSPVHVTLRVRTPDRAPMTSMRALVDGQPIRLPRPDELQRDAQGDIYVDVPIPARDSEVLLVAYNEHGPGVPGWLNVKWGGPQLPPAILPRLVVLGIGVEDYDPNKLRKLEFAHEDVDAFLSIWNEQKGRAYSEVTTRALRDPGQQEMLDGLAWLAAEARDDDYAILYLSGHGVNDKTGSYYFLPAGADLDRLSETGIHYAKIREALQSLRAYRRVLFVDTCRAGNIWGGMRALRFGETRLVNELTDPESGVVVYASSTGGQESEESKELGHGVFTWAVVEGLQGKADPQATGRVMRKKLDAFVSESVQRRTNGRQQPVSPDPLGVPDFALATPR